MAFDSPGPRERGEESRSPRPIRVWRYDEGYGAPPPRSGSTRSGNGRASHRRRSGSLGWLGRGPQGELLDLLTLLPRRYPIRFTLLLGTGLWLCWPLLQSGQGNRAVLSPGAPEVITTFIEDPQRIVTAVDLWRSRPGSILVLQGSSDTQVGIRQFARERSIRDINNGKVVTLTEGCDTFGYLTTLHRFLARQPKPGRLTVVTSEAHLKRSESIARNVLGGAGWQVEGLAAYTGDNRPESAVRLWRDHVRYYVWRLTGWDGTTDGTACRLRGGELG